VVLFGLGSIIFPIMIRKLQYFIAQIHYHIVGPLFSSLSVRFVDVLLLLRVKIKVERHL
jgi:hypothetical protein